MNPSCQILLSAIIPRPWDHFQRNHVRVAFNNVLKSFNSKLNKIFFIPTCNPFFFKDGSLKLSLFWWDGLHLTKAGLNVFKSFLYEKIDKAVKGLLA